MTSLVGDSYIDMGSNNDGGCDSDSQNGVTSQTSSPSPISAPSSTTLAPTTTTAWSGSSIVDCSVLDGLFPDPNNCHGFIKCAQVKSMFEMLFCMSISSPVLHTHTLQKTVKTSHFVKLGRSAKFCV